MNTLYSSLLKYLGAKRVYVSGMLFMEELNCFLQPFNNSLHFHPACCRSFYRAHRISLTRIIEKLGEYYATGT